MEQICGFSIQIPSQSGQLLVVESDDMEMVEDDYGFGQVFCDGLDVGDGHIDSHGLDSCPGSSQSFEERVERFGVFAFSDEDHGAARQVENDRHKPVSFADGDLVNGDAAQTPELGFGECAEEISLLDVLDYVPADGQMAGDVLNGHTAGKLKDIPLELPDEASVRVGKTDLDLPHHPAGPALDALYRQFDYDLFESKAGRSESPVHACSPNHVAGRATRTCEVRWVLLDRESDLPPHVFRLAMMIPNDVQSVIQQAGGHAWASVQDFKKPRKDQACPLLLFNRTYANTG
jgi:hypothetical protein